MICFILLNLTYTVLWAGGKNPSKAGRQLLFVTTTGLGIIVYNWAELIVILTRIYWY